MKYSQFSLICISGGMLGVLSSFVIWDLTGTPGIGTLILGVLWATAGFRQAKNGGTP